MRSQFYHRPRVVFAKCGLKPRPIHKITFISAYEYMYWARSISFISDIPLIISFQGPPQTICPAVHARTQLQNGVFVLVGSGSSSKFAR